MRVTSTQRGWNAIGAPDLRALGAGALLPFLIMGLMAAIEKTVPPAGAALPPRNALPTVCHLVPVATGRSGYLQPATPFFALGTHLLGGTQRELSHAPLLQMKTVCTLLQCGAAAGGARVARLRSAGVAVHAARVGLAASGAAAGLRDLPYAGRARELLEAAGCASRRVLRVLRRAGIAGRGGSGRVNDRRPGLTRCAGRARRVGREVGCVRGVGRARRVHCKTRRSGRLRSVRRGRDRRPRVAGRAGQRFTGGSKSANDRPEAEYDPSGDAKCAGHRSQGNIEPRRGSTLASRNACGRIGIDLQCA